MGHPNRDQRKAHPCLSLPAALSLAPAVLEGGADNGLAQRSAIIHYNNSGKELSGSQDVASHRSIPGAESLNSMRRRIDISSVSSTIRYLTPTARWVWVFSRMIEICLSLIISSQGRRGHGGNWRRSVTLNNSSFDPLFTLSTHVVVGNIGSRNTAT